MIRWNSDGKLVHEAFDSLGAIQVVDFRKHRVLRFDSLFEQSKIELKRPWLPVHEYNRAMFLPVAFVEPRRITLLGLGGGVMASGLHRLLPECRIHAVELRREVLGIAREFFDLPESERLQVTIGDARLALEELPESVADLLLADMYHSDRMSPAQSHRRFLKQCLRVLAPDGWLTINYHRQPDGILIRQMQKHFGSLFKLTSRSNNTVLFASRAPVTAVSPSDLRLAELEARLPIGWRHLMGKLEPIF